MEKNSSLRPGLKFDGLNQDSYWNRYKNGKDKTGKDVSDNAQCFPDMNPES